jgi:hypothetical protein
MRKKYKNSIFVATVILLILNWYHFNLSRLFIKNISFERCNNFEQDSKSIEEFKKLHENIIKNRTCTPRIVFNNNPDAYGYANRVYSLLSSLLIAILSDRALLINWKYIDNYYYSPMYRVFDTFNDSNAFNFKYNSNEIINFYFKNGFKKNKTIIIRNDDVLKYNSSRVKYEKIEAYFFELCCFSQFYDKLLNYDLVCKDTINNARKALQNKTQIGPGPEQDLIFQVGFEVGGNLMRKFWKPRKNVQNTIKKYYDRYFKEHFVIGLQLRFYYLNEKEDTQAFIDCAYKLEEYFNSTRITKWFISSDSEKFIKKIEKTHRDKIITTHGIIKNIAYNFLEGYNRTILDSELLSLCDAIVITGGSTFGFVSAMKSLRIPYYINGHSSMKECKRMSLSDGTINHFGFSLLKKR